MDKLPYVIDTGLVWPHGTGNLRKTTDHIQIHHTVGFYGTPEKWAALHKRKIEKDGHKGVGYNFLVCQNGEIYLGRPVDRSHGGVKDNLTNSANQRSVAIAFDGDMRDDALPTQVQWRAAIRLTKDLMAMYNISADAVLGHNEIPVYEDGRPTGKTYPTACPCIDMDAFRAELKGGNTPMTFELTSPYQRGPEYEAMQVALNAAGYDCGKADGVWGPKSDKAYRAMIVANLPQSIAITIDVNGIIYRGDVLK